VKTAPFQTPMNFPRWIYPPDGRRLVVQEQHDYEMAVNEDGAHLSVTKAPEPPVIVPLEPEHRPNSFMPAPVTIEPITTPDKRKAGRPLGSKNKR
jgi:hypothetical protein